MTIRPSVAADAAVLSALALRSKGHWGYSAAFLEACRAELTYDEPLCASGALRVAVSADEVVGFHHVAGSELEALFVDPPHIGTGVGGVLLRDALDLARARGVTRLRLAADPGAEAFYVHHGARRVGEVPSGSIPGRVLPELEFALRASPPQ
jgi:GNAT superfamily N-acetyltransferase